MKRIEDTIQIELLKWLDNNHPEVEYYYNKNEGIKTKATAMKDKKMGLKAGRPDLDLFTDVVDWTYILELELKKLDGTLTDSQIVWHGNFKPTKNRSAAIAYGLIEAKEIITNWLSSLTQEQKQ